MASSMATSRSPVEAASSPSKRPLSSNNPLPAPKKARLQIAPLDCSHGTCPSPPREAEPSVNPITSTKFLLPSPALTIPPTPVFPPSTASNTPESLQSIPPIPPALLPAFVPSTRTGPFSKSKPSKAHSAWEFSSMSTTDTFDLGSAPEVMSSASMSSISWCAGATVTSEDTEMSTPDPNQKNPYFHNLPARVLNRIFYFVFADQGSLDDAVRPYYRKGMLAVYIKTGDNPKPGEGREVVQDNIDFDVMLVNKQFLEVGSRILYGMRTFRFNDPASCKWWFKHIGTQNVSKVRNLSISIDSGFNVKVQDRCTLDLCFEEQWYQFLCWLLNRHRLENLKIEFCNWLEPRFVVPNNLEMQYEVHDWRKCLILKLRDFRGVGTARIIDVSNVIVMAPDCRKIALMMMQPKDTGYVSPIIKRKPPLEDLLQELRLKNQEIQAKRAQSQVAEQETRQVVRLKQSSINLKQKSDNSKFLGFNQASRVDTFAPAPFYSPVTKRLLQTYSRKNRGRFFNTSLFEE
ncbi:hypothetical protein LTR96_009966 [Exophiala xenobiotica]|nr:hypothetical protein LTR96_009966 [Exophiala xenobiotica]KAK5337073.1 hypothetical protein LTR98_007380 [Exophiala xenobiotica]